MTEPTPSQRDPRLYRAIAIACAFVVLATVCSVVVFALRQPGLRFVSGSWTALAVDASHGVIYRPIMGELGYGGTRYMPLHFILHGACIRALGDPLAAGLVVTALGAIGLLSGIWFLLRALGVEQRWAICGVILSLASLATQLAITTVRGDLLSAALNVWGLACVARQLERGKPRVALPVLLLVLAFAGKITTVFGVAASVTTLLLRYFDARERTSNGTQPLRAVARMFVGVLVGVTVVALLTYLASDGRVIESMRVAASGGAGLRSLLEAPFRFLYFAANDLAFLPFFFAAVIVFVNRRFEQFSTLPGQMVLWTFAGTVFIYGSPGTDFNHLLDLHVACIVFLIVAIHQGIASRFARRTLVFAAAFAPTVIIAANGALLFIFPVSLQADRLNAFQAAKDVSGPVFSEDPWVPIAGGETAYNLDSFNLRLACLRDERVRADLWQKIERHHFSGIVLTPVEDPTTREFNFNATWYGVPYYGGLHFPPGFIEHVHAFYEPVTRFHSYLVLKPRPR